MYTSANNCLGDLLSLFVFMIHSCVTEIILVLQNFFQRLSTTPSIVFTSFSHILYACQSNLEQGKLMFKTHGNIKRL